MLFRSERARIVSVKGSGPSADGVDPLDSLRVLDVADIDLTSNGAAVVGSRVLPPFEDRDVSILSDQDRRMLHVYRGIADDHTAAIRAHAAIVVHNKQLSEHIWEDATRRSERQGQSSRASLGV